MPAPKGKKKTPGRPAAGLRGERVSDYKPYNLRLPTDGRTELDATANALNRPAWRVVVDALRCYRGDGPCLNDDERHAVRAVLKLAE